MVAKLVNKTFFIALVFFVFCAYSHANDSKAPKIQQWHTSNGAKVLFVPSSELPMVDLRVVFDGGSAKDGEQAGLALMTNSMLAEGTGKLNTTDIAKHFENLGARFGTSSHRDMAIITLRSLSDKELLQPAVDMIARIIHEPSFPNESFERERKRLLIGIQSQKESISDVADKAFYTALYNKHPYAQPTSGTEDSVTAITLSDLREFHKEYYVAKNALIAIMGDLSNDQAKQLAEDLVGKLESGAAAPIVPKPDDIEKAQTVRINHPSQQTHILMGQPALSRTDPDFFPLYLGNHVLGGSGLVSRLSEEIREKRGLSYSAYSYFSPMRANGPYILGLQTKNDQADEAVEILQKTLKDFIQNGPNDKELKAAKQNITGSFPLRLASNSSIVQYLSLIGFYDLPLDYLDTFNSKIEAVSKQDIIDAYQRRIAANTMVTVIVGGEQ